MDVAAFGCQGWEQALAAGYYMPVGIDFGSFLALPSAAA